MRAGELRDRIRLEWFVNGAWALFAVVSASVIPGGSAKAAPSLIPELLAPTAGVAYEVKIRYRADMPDAVRVRWGTKILAVDTVVDPDNRRRELVLNAAAWPSYETQHAQALIAMAREGFAITFSKEQSAGYDADSDTAPAPPTIETVSGFAKWLDDTTPKSFAPGRMTQQEMRRLLFVPTTYGDTVPLNATCAIAGEDCTSESVNPIAPDSVTLAAYVVVSR